jgi:hypothetical protein
MRRVSPCPTGRTPGHTATSSSLKVPQDSNPRTRCSRSEAIAQVCEIQSHRSTIVPVCSSGRTCYTPDPLGPSSSQDPPAPLVLSARSPSTSPPSPALPSSSSAHPMSAHERHRAWAAVQGTSRLFRSRTVDGRIESDHQPTASLAAIPLLSAPPRPLLLRRRGRSPGAAPYAMLRFP